MRTLVLGGVRSGKSQLAERLAAESECEVIYLATAGAEDGSMAERIAIHRQRRPAGWGCLEEKIHLGEVMSANAAEGRCILIDCLSLWMTNLLMTEDDQLIESETDAFLRSLEPAPGRVIMVSSESNMGVIPMGELSRRYCDLMGNLHQRVAARSENVIFTVAGLPQILKGELS
ncbi:MAG: bifunctional adenosylcobinamide kinase/adenosylcobinamide-phosphate guanylyltransferase [Pseudomonadota bacterium]